MAKLRYDVFKTKPGWIGVLASPYGLCRLTFPRTSADEARSELFRNIREDIDRLPEHFNGIAARLRAYFDGQRASFDDELDLSGATRFEKDVWTAIRLIPPGETRSYGWVARQIGRPQAARAVGQALGRNPLPVIIPCHRVVTSDGKLGGFGGGLEMKRFLLCLEASTASPASSHRLEIISL